MHCSVFEILQNLMWSVIRSLTLINSNEESVSLKNLLIAHETPFFNKTDADLSDKEVEGVRWLFNGCHFLAERRTVGENRVWWSKFPECYTSICKRMSISYFRHEVRISYQFLDLNHLLGPKSQKLGVSLLEYILPNMLWVAELMFQVGPRIECPSYRPQDIGP